MRSIAESEALDLLSRDGLVAFPTETVWGVAARARSAKAVERLRAFKGRDAGKPLSILVDSAESAAEVAARWSPAARVLAERFWPGPLTLVVECGEVFAPGVAAGDGSIGVRCSPHPVASALASGARTRGLGPVTATSLNRGGDPAARDRAEAARICGDEIPMLAGEAGGGTPSSVVDVRGSEPRLLREGPIPASALELR